MPSSAAMMAHAVGHRCNTSTEHGPDEVSANGRAHKTTMSSPAYTPDTGQSESNSSARRVCHQNGLQLSESAAQTPSSLPYDIKTPQSNRSGPGDIETKEGLEPGFLTWLKRISAGSFAGSKRSSLRGVVGPRRLSSANAPANNSGDAELLVRYLETCSAKTGIDMRTVQNLLDLGADVNSNNERGESPLHFAVALGSIPVMAQLLELNADPEARTSAGESIWTYAKNNLSIHAHGMGSSDQEKLRSRVEFARATVKYNPGMIRHTEYSTDSRKRQRKHPPAEPYRPRQRRRQEQPHHAQEPCIQPHTSAAAAMPKEEPRMEYRSDFGQPAFHKRSEPSLAIVPPSLILRSNADNNLMLTPSAQYLEHTPNDEPYMPWLAYNTALSSNEIVQTQETTDRLNATHANEPFEPSSNTFMEAAQSTDGFFPDPIHFRWYSQNWI